jgi:hypothetical protein
VTVMLAAENVSDLKALLRFPTQMIPVPLWN